MDSKVFAGPCSHIYDHSIMWPLPDKQWAWLKKKHRDREREEEEKRRGVGGGEGDRGKQIVVYVHFHYHLIPFHLCGRIIYARCCGCCCFCCCRCLPKLASICPTHTHRVHAPMPPCPLPTVDFVSSPRSCEALMLIMHVANARPMDS